MRISSRWRMPVSSTSLVVDNHKAWFWQRRLAGPKLYPTVTLRTGGEIAWAIRNNSPPVERRARQLFLATQRPRLAQRADDLPAGLLLNTQFVRGAAAEARTASGSSRSWALFRRYGAQYNMDWMLMAAQGTRNRGSITERGSHVGAIGVMQVMPATGKELKVGDITQLEPNIHAGVKYMRSLVNRYYANEPMDDLNKALFAFAAYNAGPGMHACSLRCEAAARGLDANVWFNNVERIASERIGRETVTYVSNIHK